MALSFKNDNDQDERLNPARSLNDAEQQASYDTDFNDLTSDEHQKKSGTSGDLADGVRKAENEPDAPASYLNNFTGDQQKKLKSINGVHFLRRKGPLGVLITLLLGGGLGFSALFSPGLLIVQMKEVMVDKFNTQLASMEVRTTKLLSAKIDNTTGGICGQKITIKCKYSTMSIKQVEKFKTAGIDVNYNKTSIVGRAKPTSFTFQGKEVAAVDFNKTLVSDSSFRSAVRTAYNPKFAGFTDKVWSGIKTRFKLSKSDPKPAVDDTDRAKNLADDVKYGDSSPTRLKAGAIDPTTKKEYSQTEIDKINAEIDKLEVESKSGNKAASTVFEGIANEAGDAAGATLGKALNFVKVTGVADSGCQAYTAVQSVGYAAKTVRAVQLARYAMFFMKTADMIKAGTAKPGDVAYAGKILTEIAYDAKSTIKRGSATDSAGYKFAAYGDTGGFSKKDGGYVSQFLAGGGLAGDLIGLTSAINTTIGGAPKKTCSFLGNPWVGAGSAVLGIALMLVPGAGQAAGVAKVVVQGAAEATLSLALMALPELLKDIVAGNVTAGIYGEDSGNGYTSGAGGTMSSLASAGGNSPLTPDQAVAYNNLQSSVIAQNANDERLALSPLDTSSRYTFLGSIVSNLSQYSSSVSSLSGILYSVGSITSSAFTGLVPKSGAVSDAQYADSLKVCQDYDYNDLTGDGSKKVATDPFCNVIYGLPEKYLNKDPLVVIDELGDQINQETGQPSAGSNYETFVKNCIGRVEPLGSLGIDGQGTYGDECLVNDSNANYYLHYVDQRVNTGMDGYEEEVAAPTPQSGVIERPANTDDYGNGWNLRNGVDYSSYACDPRTQDLGTYTEPNRRYTIRICDTNIAGDKTTINSLISANFMNMYEAAKAAGITFYMAEGLRKAGEPYYSAQSRHTAGLAFDIGSTQNGNSSFCWVSGGSVAVAKACRSRQGPAGDAVRWLDANAATYGFQNLNGEAWHWSTGEMAQEFNVKK